MTRTPRRRRYVAKKGQKMIELTCSVAGALGTLEASAEILKPEDPLKGVAEARAHAAVDEEVQRIVEDQPNWQSSHHPL